MTDKLTPYDVLRDDGEDDVHIGAEDLRTLVDILAFVSVALSEGRLWFNKPGESNRQYAEFCDRMARKFANIKIEREV